MSRMVMAIDREVAYASIWPVAFILILLPKHTQPVRPLTPPEQILTGVETRERSLRLAEEAWPQARIRLHEPVCGSKPREAVGEA